MDKEKFEELVAAVVESLPEEFVAYLDNIDVVVEDEPTAAQRHNARLRRTHTLLGLYEGIPLTDRSSNYGLVPPDKITIFQKPIEDVCSGEHEIMVEISKVVKHEIAHHFGIDDARLKQIERGRA